MKRNKHTSAAVGHSVVTVIGIGAAIAVVLSAVLSALLTSLVINGSIGESQTGIGIFIIRAISVLLGGLVGAGLSKEKYLLTVGIIALSYLLVLLGLGITLYDGSFKNFGSGVISTLIGALAAYLILMRPRGKRKHTARYNR